MRWYFVILIAVMTLVNGCASRYGGDAETASTGIELSLSMSRGTALSPESVAGIGAQEVSFGAGAGEADTIDPVYSYRIQIGDPVIIHLRGIYPRDEQIEDIVDDAGNITLPFLGDIPAAGKSTSQVESDIRSAYIDGGYYRTITISVIMPQRTYFIRGEVRQPGRYPIVGGLTLMQAIATAGGYTEFASQRNIQLIRGSGRPIDVNMRRIERNPENDIRLESGDVIVVGRSLF
jgi:protein involved in polysaccharide export with SLBB domain